MATHEFENVVLDTSQQEALSRAVDCNIRNRIVAITGGPGTGKTTIMRNVENTLTSAGYDCVMCAPTGKAAKRIKEATGKDACTIHRLLEFPFPHETDAKGKPLATDCPKRDRMNPIDARIVLADEYAMVNRELHSYLIDALPSGGRLIMFGDVNQLRPIESTPINGKYESPFEQAIRRFEGVQLSKVHRFGEGSGIALNGHNILKGNMLKRFDDFVISGTDQPLPTLRELAELSEFKDINSQIITPITQSWVGTYKINLLLQNILNPLKYAERILLPRQVWNVKNPIRVGVGDKVICTQNTYDMRNEEDRKDRNDTYTACPPNLTMLNGETGIVIAIVEGEGIDIDMGDRIVNVPSFYSGQGPKARGEIVIDPRKCIDLAYAITTHKAQGSEYAKVIYIINKSNFLMQCRPNIYTAITRAKYHARVISDQRSLVNSISRNLSAMDIRNRKS